MFNKGHQQRSKKKKTYNKGSESYDGVVPCDALSKLLMSVLTVGEGSEEVEDRLLRPIPCLRAARSLSTAFI